MPHSVVTPAPIIDDTQACIDKIEQRIRSLHVSDGVIGWDGYDDLPVAALPVEFRMPDIERYTGIGCPRIHLQLYSAVMRGHRLDEAQMIMLFPLSLSGAAVETKIYTQIYSTITKGLLSNPRQRRHKTC